DGRPPVSFHTALCTRELLRNGFSVREVSDRLGYSEPAAFTHAYTRWRGMPPSAR
ncbi:helix-turn-helix domain-containing protein, partial [Mycobacteroides abscessus]|uniref:helix-turn-helix domain-containing protein n=1 Tax=Mycobacteroides abscessus TaxID=36809 RepID=UPI003CEA9371